MNAYVAEDYDFIAKRLKEFEQERQEAKRKAGEKERAEATSSVDPHVPPGKAEQEREPNYDYGC